MCRIRADTIEDPILRAMRAETISAQQAALEEQQRVQDHWSIETLDKKASVQDVSMLEQYKVCFMHCYYFVLVLLFFLY